MQNGRNSDACFHMMYKANDFGPHVHIAQSIDHEQRYDVAEFIICFAPLMTSKKCLPDTCWTAMMSLLGLSEVTGEIVSDTECAMTGTMSTHPPLRVHVKLNMHPLQLPTQYILQSIKIIPHLPN
jgi:hypothetical protein